VVLNGSSLDQNILVEADIQNADLMVALTNDDQVNILSSVMAKRLGCKANLALINNPSYQTFTKTLGIDAHINPRAVTISRILQHVRRGRIRAVYSVQKGAAEVIEAEALETSRWSASRCAASICPTVSASARSTATSRCCARWLAEDQGEGPGGDVRGA
jgi:trk system potassium uptake protein TrkA